MTMKRARSLFRQRRTACAAFLFFSFVPLLAGQGFVRMAEELDTEGDFFAYADLRGEAAKLGDHLTGIYTAYLESNPEAMPVPLDFSALFQTFGIDGIGALGYSSMELADNLHRNRCVLLLEGEPRGLLQLYDLTPRKFRAAAIAPADATIAIDITLRLGALRNIATEMATSVMGPMGAGIVEGSLQQPLTSSGLTGNDLLGYLSHPLTIVGKQTFDLSGGPAGQAYLEIVGAASLIDHLIAFAETGSQVTVREEDGEMIVDLSRLLADTGTSLFAKKADDGETLLLYTSAEFLARIGTGETLAESATFHRLAAHLPAEAAAFSYQQSPFIDSLLESFREQPQMASYLPVIHEAFDRLLADFLGPQASAYYAIDGGIVSDTYASFSMKEAVAVLPVAFVGGIAAAAAIPALQNVETLSEEEPTER